jgi:Sec-independent protein translocase protein TatA
VYQPREDDIDVATPIRGPELIIVLAIFVLLFGAKKLPELGGST